MNNNARTLTALLVALLGMVPAWSGAAETASSAWRTLINGSEPPSVPESWAKKEPAPAEIRKFLTAMATQVSANAGQAKAFYQKYPADRRAREARLAEIRQLAIAVHFGETNRAADLQQARASAPAELTAEERFFVESGVANRLNYLEQMHPGLTDLQVLEKEGRRLQSEFKGSLEVDELLLDIAKAHLTLGAHDKARLLAEEVARTTRSDDFKESAEGIALRVGMINRPLQLQFTALDGRAVDLAKLKGKVVLIDAWATWCTLCMEKLPELKSIYRQLRGKGFEVVGLNFDEERALVERLIARERIEWPNYFDGKGWENRYGKQFKVTSLPALWLVDRKGVVRDVSAHYRTREKIEKLLSE